MAQPHADEFSEVDGRARDEGAEPEAEEFKEKQQEAEGEKADDREKNEIHHL